MKQLLEPGTRVKHRDFGLGTIDRIVDGAVAGKKLYVITFDTEETATASVKNFYKYFRVVAGKKALKQKPPGRKITSHRSTYVPTARPAAGFTAPETTTASMDNLSKKERQAIQHNKDKLKLLGWPTKKKKQKMYRTKPPAC